MEGRMPICRPLLKPKQRSICTAQISPGRGPWRHSCTTLHISSVIIHRQMQGHADMTPWPMAGLAAGPLDLLHHGIRRLRDRHVVRPLAPRHAEVSSRGPQSH